MLAWAALISCLLSLMNSWSLQLQSPMTGSLDCREPERSAATFSHWPIRGLHCDQWPIRGRRGLPQGRWRASNKEYILSLSFFNVFQIVNKLTDEYLMPSLFWLIVNENVKVHLWIFDELCKLYYEFEEMSHDTAFDTKNRMVKLSVLYCLLDKPCC